MMPETVDNRVLGAVRFVDAATNAQISDGISVAAPQADLRKNRSGLWVIWKMAALEAHNAAFDAPPAAPALGSVAMALTVSDSTGRYLARNATVMLPRDANAQHADKAASLFQAAEVKMYCSPAAPVSPGWAILRAHVQDAASKQPLAGALLRTVRTADSVVLARGISDSRGEALVVVPGIPVTTFNTGHGPPLATEVDVTVEAWFDKTAGPVIDPDAVEGKAGLPKTSSPEKLAARQSLTVLLEISLA